MPYEIRIHRTGGPEVMQWEEAPAPKPGKGEALIRQTVVGLNYIDTYQRSGLYKVDLPGCIGMEATGVVEAVGEGVTEVKPGDRVGYVMGRPGAYAEMRTYPAWRLIPLPDDVSDETAAAAMLKGLTVAYLTKRTFKVEKGQTVLLHAAAGGVGLIACQWLNRMGVTVIGTAGSDEKAALARAHGCHHTIVYTREDFTSRVKELTDGKGVPVVYDAVGADTFRGSLDCLAPFGTFVSFGNASGPIAGFNPAELSAKGSLYFTRPGLHTHTMTRPLTLELADWLFEAIRGGVKIEINQRYALKDAAQAHADLEGRKTTGSTVFTV
ncbi:MAG: quinone oxidoreductase [Alphaproteobacteria bacterium]